MKKHILLVIASAIALLMMISGCSKSPEQMDTESLEKIHPTLLQDPDGTVAQCDSLVKDGCKLMVKK